MSAHGVDTLVASLNEARFPIPDRPHRTRPHLFQALISWVIDSGLVGRGAARAEDAHGTPTQSQILPSILVYEEKNVRIPARLHSSLGKEPVSKPVLVSGVDFRKLTSMAGGHPRMLGVVGSGVWVNIFM